MKLLFVCIENSCRSQMAEAFARMSGDDIEAFSAGSRASGVVNPRAVEMMAELGYDLGRHRSRSIEEVEGQGPFDAVVTMGCGDACPHVPARMRLDWDLADPKHMPPAEFRKIRDEIGRLVERLVAKGTTQASSSPPTGSGAEERRPA